MRHVNKLVLVPLEEWEKVKGKNKDDMYQQVTVSPPALPNQTPQQNLNKVDPSMVTNLNTRMKSQKGMGKLNLKMKLENKLRALSPSKRERALSLLRYINNSKVISWNDKWSLVYNGKVLHNSNIQKLISHAVQNSNEKPEGMKTFYKALSEINVPNIIVKNYKGKKIMEKYIKKKDDKFRPPGVLDIQRK